MAWEWGGGAGMKMGKGGGSSDVRIITCQT